MTEKNRGALAIDQGTQSTRAILFDERGNQLAVAKRTVSLNRIDRTHVEQDGAGILASVQECIAEVLATVGPGVVDVAGLATQRSSVIAWDPASGAALSPLLSWQDRREHRWLESLQQKAGEIHDITGLRLTPHYGASKLRWLLLNDSRVREAHRANRLMMGPLAAYLVANLTGQALVDHANASRTQLWNLRTGNWDDRLLRLFGIDRACLPEVLPIRSDYGKLAGNEIHLTAVNGDQTAALHADGAVDSDSLLINIGTGAFVLKPTGSKPVTHAALLSGVCDSVRESRSYLLEGTVNGAGAALRRAEKQHGFRATPDSLEQAMTACPDPDLLFINSVGGLGSPWWREGPPPHWVDVTGREVSDPGPQAAIASIIESILFLVMFNIEAIGEAGMHARRLRISGGLSNLDSLCRKLASLSNLPVERTAQPEATARGIAWQALGGPAGWIRSDRDVFEPAIDPALNERYRHFTELLAKLL